jgi:diguanylate cyclase (GGDEF)-like protein
VTSANRAWAARESARLAEVRSYGVLDTVPEHDFDAIVALAAEICGTPISAISIVDDRRQWFKSRVGLAVAQTSRDDSFCSHAIETPDEIFVVADASKDARFVKSELVTGPPHMRFYAGAPICSPGGLPLGALCVIDVVPRTFSRKQARALRTLADQVQAQLQVRRQFRDAREREEALATSRRRLRERTSEIEVLRHANDHDALTGLLSRARFERAVLEKTKDPRILPNPFAVIVLNIDDFHEVNASYGVASGNLLLKAVAGTVASLAERALVGRLYADEFAILVELDDPAEVCDLAETVIRSFARPFTIDREAVRISASAGIAYATGAREHSTDLIADADTALERARELGGNAYSVYSSDMNDVSVARAAVRDRLHEAIRTQQFELHYQPKIDLRSRQVVGCEALIRWPHPERGLQSPASFIPVAEQSGLIVPIGEWVIREACRQYVAWRNDGVRNVPIALNVSAAQFRRSNVLAFIRDTLREYAIPPEALEIEITEGMLLNCSDDLVTDLQALRAAGVGIALDDFGTGFSSLGYLHRLPLTLLKVDQTFVRGALTNNSDLAIVRSIVHLAKQLELRTVAEGVESREQLELVTDCGCDEAQGYYFCRPLGPSDFGVFLTTRSAPIQNALAAVLPATR